MGLDRRPDAQRAQTHRHLLEAEGFNVSIARDGELARKLVGEKGPPPLAVIDLSLARIDGFALSRLIRSQAARGKAKIVAHSASAALRTTAQQKQAELGLSGIFASWAPVETVKKALRRALEEPAVIPPVAAAPREIPMLHPTLHPVMRLAPWPPPRASPRPRASSSTTCRRPCSSWRRRTTRCS